MKVTSPEDLAVAERWLRGGQTETRVETRVGMGFDVHAFGPGDQVTLCGVPVPHDAGLVGHSDADVGLPAFTYALLRPLGAGDLGNPFPPSHPTLKCPVSGRFPAHAPTPAAPKDPPLPLPPPPHHSH